MFTARTMGFPLRRSIAATSWSEAVRPVRMSVKKTMTVAVSMAVRAWSRMNSRIWLSVRGSMPPVSTRVKDRPHQSDSP